ncbi:TOMM precursor leader peptide-binding protein [Nonomuraea soli]|uniref:Ribosomal protein S12 methylthiotransferase accessory factor n=1 Tax=Nonomuraea soli TaxID=1032476 RepID=A0A7W0CQM8_9ACTN|nr:TOMM precursor leader peptide-binding protein [Nonomuraea soli]MBA2895394.1 ribosomal protein S12 methylthiotransferase accessory factor [Nonomuraea soli]
MREVALVGHGLMYDAIAAHLATGRKVACHGTAAHVGGAPDLLIAADDSWNTARTAQTRAAATALAVPWLRVRAELGQVVIGPMETPGVPGCVSCAERRRRRVRADQAGHRAIWRRHGEVLRERPSSWVTPLAATQVAELVAAEVASLSGGATPRTSLALLMVDLERLDVGVHPFLPDAFCGTCGDAPDDTAELADLVLEPRRMHRERSFRTRDVTQDLEELYVDKVCGLVGSISEWTAGVMAVASAGVGGRDGEVTGYGRAETRAAARRTAVLEGLERYGGAPGARRPSVRASFAEVAGHALDPRTLGLYPPERYRLPGFRYRPFDVDETYTWVWGYSFARKEPILVPESCAYYQNGHELVYEISNGCALGGSIEEAVLHGVLEVAERDAFLLTWYCRMPAPRIDISGVADRRLRLQHACVEAETGYDVSFHDISVEQRIPCVWAVAVNPRDDGRAATISAAGSSPDPERAIANALSEVAASIAPAGEKYDEHAEQARRMVDEPALVKEMEDHALLYAHPAAARRLDFLTRAPGRRRPADIGDTRGFSGTDLTSVLNETVGRYLETGLDVIVIDQTGTEHRAGGLACVKVLIPGTLSMTFGHDYRRLHDLPRLLTVPRLLGHRDRDLAPEELASDPHPFP